MNKSIYFIKKAISNKYLEVIIDCLELKILMRNLKFYSITYNIRIKAQLSHKISKNSVPLFASCSFFLLKLGL